MQRAKNIRLPRVFDLWLFFFYGSFFSVYSIYSAGIVTHKHTVHVEYTSRRHFKRGYAHLQLCQLTRAKKTKPDEKHVEWNESFLHLGPDSQGHVIPPVRAVAKVATQNLSWHPCQRIYAQIQRPSRDLRLCSPEPFHATQSAGLPHFCSNWHTCSTQDQTEYFIIHSAGWNFEVEILFDNVEIIDYHPRITVGI